MREKTPFYVSLFLCRDTRLLEKLLIEQTKSRARRSNDNALVESKNGSVIRKHFGFSHIEPIRGEFHKTLVTARRLARFFHLGSA